MGNYLTIIKGLEDDLRNNNIKLNRSTIKMLYPKRKKSKFESWVDFVEEYYWDAIEELNNSRD